MTVNLNDLPDFTIGEGDFEPRYYPEKCVPTKERNLSREDGLCDGEQITDTGSKNVELNIRGFLLEDKKDSFWEILDSGKKYRLVSMPWSGDVFVKNGDLRGPKGIDRNRDKWVYEYTLQVVEAGGSGMENDGVVQ